MLILYWAIIRYSRVGGQNWGNLVHVVVECPLGYYQWKGFHLGLSWSVKMNGRNFVGMNFEFAHSRKIYFAVYYLDILWFKLYISGNIIQWIMIFECFWFSQWKYIFNLMVHNCCIQSTLQKIEFLMRLFQIHQID